ncbi:uncharacterized protein BDZ99DRAFT_515088 [Mytilinidion resinicola]|uniref:Uncharacterized protein n=1 Tax=Mytilinidion resinicola TaxID=574789 RepID=A0A6A6Z5X9_9PEZI|nr:uncharacterized protein BDZ99DRAFT_515088 [Mytilinidion resinicola]KAF2816501.1 hypothetical protein BDZ99DRAFT_515088 [Mytilinidion resinicola]
MSTDKMKADKPEFTPREAELMAAAFRSMRGMPNKGPDIDYARMAVILGMTKGSVSNLMRPLKKRIFAGDSAPATPRKTPGGRGKVNSTPASSRGCAKTKAIMAALDDQFVSNNGPDADGSPTPIPSRRMNTSSPLKRKAGELFVDNEAEEGTSVAVREPRRKRQASLFASSRIKKEPTDNDDEDGSSSSATADSIADPEYEGSDLH